VTAPGKSALALRRESHALHVTLDRPETGNLVTEAVLDELLAVLASVRDDPGIRMLTLSGAGDDFSLGGDRQEFDRLIAEDPTGARVHVFAAKARQVCEGLAGSGAVTIARLHGRVVGAGLALALFCDLRVGAEDTTFRLPELAVGLPTAWGGALPRLMQEAGAARVRELVLTGDRFGAADALRMGMLHRVVPAGRLDDAVQAWIRPLARRSALALRVTKGTLNAYTAASRLGDTTLVEGDLLASVLAARHHAARQV
jgi:methylglutaconyl-CoA hydratase